MSIVPWESWVYVNLGEGVEFTFTDEMGNGVYGYAPPPDFPESTDSFELHRFSLLTHYAPEVIANRSYSEVPEFYRPGGAMSGLGFAYDFADFRGPDGKTRLETYFAIDPTEMSTVVSGDTSRIFADCAVVLTDTAYEQIYRALHTISFTSLGHRKWPEGAFIPNIVSIVADPGSYILTVQINDRVSQRKGLYRHRLNLEPYGRDSLQISDIQLSWNISGGDGDEKFRKGEVWVIPMSTRAYAENQNAYAYYEIYNLTRDSFGQTRYRLTYTITAEDPKRPFNLVRSSIGALTGLFDRGGKPQVSFSLEQTGSQASSPGYFELDLEKVKPGYSRLSVSIEDLNAQQSALKDIQFRYGK